MNKIIYKLYFWDVNFRKWRYLDDFNSEYEAKKEGEAIVKRQRNYARHLKIYDFEPTKYKIERCF